MAMPTLELFLLILFVFLPLTLYILLCPKSIKIPNKDRHVFISGGSSGIGLALAHQAASQRARVSILAIDQKQLEEAQESIQISTGVEVAIFYADVRDVNALEKAVEAAGPIDVLICNHGVFIAKEMELQEIENVKLMIDVNLMGTFNLIKAALPGMRMNRSSRGPASIALMSSQAEQGSCCCCTLEQDNEDPNGKVENGLNSAKDNLMPDLCVICPEHEYNVVFVPCCTSCSSHLNNCPLCRRLIDQVVRTYRH